MDPEFVEYRPTYRSELIQLWNRVFEGRRHAVPLDRTRWSQAIDRPELEPAYFRIALVDGRVAGFAHGGIWDGAFLECYRPEEPSVMGYLAMIAVDPEFRRQGLGRLLVRSLGETIQTREQDRLGEHRVRIEADGRMFNPYYGNGLAPRPPLWGTTEGVAVPIDDTETRCFFGALGFEEEVEAVSLTLDLASVAPLSGEPFDAELEIVTDHDYLAELGTNRGSTFGETNRSRTWVAAKSSTQLASLVAFPMTAPARRAAGAQTDRSGEASRWGIHSVEVSPEARGMGLGSHLLRRFLSDLRDEGVSQVETLALPEESSAAWRLYDSAGFREVARWVVLGGAISTF